ncbi:MAG: type II secretion system F family protein [Candidatus Planktophila sp.]
MNPILISLLLSITAASLLIFGTASEMKQIIASKKDRSLIRARLAELDKANPHDYEEFRFIQLTYTCIAALIVLTGGIIVRQNLLSTIFFVIIAGSVTYFYYDRRLTYSVKRQRSAIDSEFPAIIEMLTLAISAGESPLSAFKRISEQSHGYLSRKFRTVISHVHQGAPFHSALDLMGRDLNSPLVRKFVDSLVNAMVRGAPITEVLIRHAQEARDHQRNQILAAAGKAEISMMIPVVFLILPISMLFALWPSLMNLNLFAS